VEQVKLEGGDVTKSKNHPLAYFRIFWKKFFCRIRRGKCQSVLSRTIGGPLYKR